MCWVNDKILVSASWSKMALWKIEDTVCNEDPVKIPSYTSIQAIDVKPAEKIQCLVYNKQKSELAALSLNGYIQTWDAETCVQVSFYISSRIDTW